MALDTNLISYWKLDSSSNDSVTTNNGTDTAISYVSGKIGGSASFNGSSSNISLPNVCPAGAGAKSISAWFNVSVLPALNKYQALAYWGAAVSTQSFGLGISNVGGVYKVEMASYANDLFYTFTPTVGQWYHLSTTYDGTTAKLYLNGVEVASGARTINVVNGIYHHIGLISGEETFNGLIDEVGLWSRAITADEISQIFNSCRGNTYPFIATPSLYGGVAYYKLDETSGNAIDSIGGSTATNIGSTAYGSGKINNGAIFDSSSKALSISNYVPFNFERTDAFSLSLWVKPTTLTENSFLFSHQTDGGDFAGYSLFQVTSGNLRFYLANNNSTAMYWTTTSNPLTTSSWYHIVVTNSGTSNAAGSILYINGSVVAKTTGSDNASGSIKTTAEPQIGNRGTNYSNNSQIDEVSVFSRVLSSTEVTALYNSGLGLQYPFQSSNTVGFFAIL
jgi:hypothetical protein